MRCNGIAKKGNGISKRLQRIAGLASKNKYRFGRLVFSDLSNQLPTNTNLSVERLDFDVLIFEHVFEHVLDTAFERES